MIYATWCISNNVGDALNCWLLRKIWPEKTVSYAHPGSYFKKLMLCGSILNHADKNTIVCGAGIANITDEINPECDIRCVRGPISLMRANECGNPANAIIGDPAFLCPMFFAPPAEKKFHIGVVPHFMDQATIFSSCKDMQKISVFEDVENFITRISECEVIVSSSLHGIIFAHAYGIPAVWFETSELIGGDGTKFKDYYMSVGLDIKPVGWYQVNNMSKSEIQRVATLPRKTIDIEGMLECIKR